MDSGRADSGIVGLAEDGRFLVTSNVIDTFRYLAPRYGEAHTNIWGYEWTGTNLFFLDGGAFAEFAFECILRDNTRKLK
jgi:hypothetical protein